MTNIKNFIIGFVLVALFVFSFVSFGRQFQLDMGSNQTILNESVSGLNESYYDIETDLSEASTTAKASRNRTEGEQLEVSGGEITYRSIPKSTLSFWGTVSGIFSVIGSLLISTLGVPVIVIGAISTIIVISLIYYFWKNIRTGN